MCECESYRVENKKWWYMEYNNTSWFPSSLADVNPLHDERNTNEPWKDPSAVGTHAPTQAIDMHEFGLGDLQPGTPAFPIPPLLSSYPHPASSSSTPQPFYSFSPSAYHLPTPPQSFNGIPFNNQQWIASTSQLPLSSYSSLNGATSTSASNQQSPSASTPIQPMIECVLTFSSL